MQGSLYLIHTDYCNICYLYIRIPEKRVAYIISNLTIIIKVFISSETCENIQFYVLPIKAAFKEPKSKQKDYAKLYFVAHLFKNEEFTVNIEIR